MLREMHLWSPSPVWPDIASYVVCCGRAVLPVGLRDGNLCWGEFAHHSETFADAAKVNAVVLGVARLLGLSLHTSVGAVLAIAHLRKAIGTFDRPCVFVRQPKEDACSENKKGVNRVQKKQSPPPRRQAGFQLVLNQANSEACV